VFDDPSALRKDLAALCLGFEGAGLELAPILAAAGLPGRPETLSDDQLPPSPDGHRALWMAAMAARPEPVLGLRVGACVPWGAYDVIDYLAATCPDLRSGTTELARYFGLITPFLSLAVVDEDRGAALEVTAHVTGPAAEIVVLYTIGVTLSHFRHAVQDPVCVELAELQTPEPTDAGPFEEILGGDVRFSSLRNLLWLSDASWRAPSRRAEPALRTVLRRYADEAVDKRGVGDRLTGRLMPLIIESLATGDATLDKLAPRLALSPRTLQRRLADEGRSFKEEVERARQSLAGRYLTDRRLSVGEVAWLLGYSEPSAFVRAFERWTGTTPGRYRTEALGTTGDSPR
jgi:AraC-like DNA-binding protein